MNMNYFSSEKPHEDLDNSTDGSRRIAQETRKNGYMNFDERKAAIHFEMDKVKQLPPRSSYAQHRSRVLNKLLHLISIEVRTTSQDEELELLFAGLSL